MKQEKRKIIEKAIDRLDDAMKAIQIIERDTNEKKLNKKIDQLGMAIMNLKIYYDYYDDNRTQRNALDIFQ